MSLSVRIVTDKNTWDRFVSAQVYTPFVQAWNYGEFNEAMGDKMFPIGIFEGDNMVGACLAIRIKARRGDYLYCPYGPLLDWDKVELFDAFVSYLKDLGKQEKVAFVRVSPFLVDIPRNQHIFSRNGFHRAPIHALAETTWMLDIRPDFEKLMKSMNKNHRNLIRRAKRDGVKIVMQERDFNLDSYFELYEETVKRHHFVPFSRNYIESEVVAFSGDSQVVVYDAYYEGAVIASSIMYYYGSMAVYRHGASTSDDKYRKIPASYLLQWEAIKEAKRRGCRYYNFWGVAPPGSKKSHPYYGITHFKKGFGGEQYDLLPCQDLRLSWRYWLSFVVETLRKWRRGF